MNYCKLYCTNKNCLKIICFSLLFFIKGIWVRKTGGNLLRLKVPGNLCGEKVPGIFTGGGKGAGDGKRCREFVRPVGKGLVTGDYQ